MLTGPPAERPHLFQPAARRQIVAKKSGILLKVDYDGKGLQFMGWWGSRKEAKEAREHMVRKKPELATAMWSIEEFYN